MAKLMFPGKLALGLIVGASCQTGSVYAAANKALLDQGLFWQTQGNNERAAEAWKKLLRLEPDEPRALYGLAQVEINQKRSPAELLARLQALDPNSPFVALLEQDINLRTAEGPKALDKARLLYESREVEQALEQFQLALRGKEPQGAIALEYYLMLSQSASGFKPARSGLERLAKASPNDPQIEMHLAFLLARGEAPKLQTRIEGIERLARVALIPSVSGFATESWKMALGWLNVTKTETLGLFDNFLKVHPDDTEVRELRNVWAKKLQAQSRSAEPPPLNPQIAAGLKALKQGDLEQAEGEYQARLKTSPNDPDALGGLGVVRLQQYRLEESQALLIRATQQKKGANWAPTLKAASYQLLIEQAVAAQREADFSAAASLLQQAIKLDPKQSSADLALGTMQFESGQLVAAEISYRELLARLENNVAAMRGLALVLAAADKPEEARSIIKRLSPDQVGGIEEMKRLRSALVSGLAKAALRRGDLPLARSTLEEAMAQDRDNPWIRWELADLYAKQGRVSEARGLIDGLLASQPDNPVALFASASFAAANGQFRSALATLDRIAGEDRSADMAKLQRRSWLQYQAALARDLAGQNRRREALALLAQAEQLTGASRDLVGLLAEAYVDAGAPNRGLAMMRQQIARSSQPLPADLLQYAGLLLKTQQDVECAGVLQDLGSRTLTPDLRQRLDDLSFLHELRQVDLLRERGALLAANDKLLPLLRQRPADPLAIAVQARWFAASGERKKALDLSGQLAEKYPDKVEFQLAAAQLAAQFKQPEQADKAIKAALALAPDDSELLASAARLYQAVGKSTQAAALFERAIALQNAPLPKPAALLVAAADNQDAQGKVWPAWLPTTQLPPTSPAAYLSNAQPAPVLLMAAVSESAATEKPSRRNLNKELDAIKQAHSPELRVGAQTLQRSGNAGSSQLKLSELPVELSYPVGEGKVMLQVTQVALNTGALTDKAHGLARSIGYESEGLSVDLGQTPVGFTVHHVSGGLKFNGSLGAGDSLTYRANLSSRPVTDSLQSYAGLVDPLTGQRYGGVMARGLRLELSKDQGGYGFTGAVALHSLRGEQVASNRRREINLGGYVELLRPSDKQFSSGLNFTSLAYQKNLSDFGVNQGGYFSPQRYSAITVPLNWSLRTGRVSYKLEGALGYQKFQQDGALDASGLPTPSQSNSGLAYKLAASAMAQIAPQWYLDASLHSDNSARGSYHQWAAGLTLRYSFYTLSPEPAGTSTYGQ